VRPGFEHTIRIEAPPPLHAEANTIVQILLATDLFRSFDAASVVDVLSVITSKTYMAKDVICAQAEENAHLRIIRSGTVNYERDGATRELRHCDYFGEVRPCGLSDLYLYIDMYIYIYISMYIYIYTG